jgi:hypothetical protein
MIAQDTTICPSKIYDETCSSYFCQHYTLDVNVPSPRDNVVAIACKTFKTSDFPQFTSEQSCKHEDFSVAKIYSIFEAN